MVSIRKTIFRLCVMIGVCTLMCAGAKTASAQCGLALKDEVMKDNAVSEKLQNELDGINKAIENFTNKIKKSFRG